SPNKKPLELFGFDIDVLPGGAYKDIEILLGTKGNIEVQKLKLLLKRVENETRKDEIIRLKQAEQYIVSELSVFTTIYRKETLKDITASLRQLIESFEFIDVAYENPNSQQWMDIAGKREKTMMWQIDDRLSKPGRIILIGHNSHLAKDSNTLNLLSSSSNQFVSMWLAVGTYLHQKMEKQMYTVWMLYGGGKRGTGPECPKTECNIEIKSGTVNSLLLAVSKQKPFLLNLSNEYLPPFLRQPIDIQFNGSNINSSILTNQCDSIIFVPEVHPTDKF
ncbi:MAG: erythromycin esterase family protein, partial [Bdellovibrio sp.]